MARDSYKIKKSLNISPSAAAGTTPEAGDLRVDSSDNSLNYHDGSSEVKIPTPASTTTLTNKTIDADLNTITNIEDADIKAAAAIALTKLATTTISRALVSSGSGVITPATTTATEIGYVNGVTSAIQTQLDNKQSLDSDLTAVAGLSTTGLIARTGTGTATTRTLTAGSSKIAVTTGDGVSGNPTVDVTEANLTLNNIGGTLGLTKGGTGQITANASLNALLPSQAAASGLFLGSNGTNTSWSSPPTAVRIPNSVQRFTTGSGTYNKNYTFVITSGSATVGATYTNNAVTFTVNATVASATQVVLNGSGAPAASGTLTKSAGTGDATLTFTAVYAPVSLRVRMIGGGGGGGGSGSASGNNGTAGSATTFGSSLLTANGGALGGFGAANPSAGGTATVASPAITLAASTGAAGQGSSLSGAGGTGIGGGNGASTPFGGSGAGGSYTITGQAGIANTGAGGGGGGSPGPGLSGSGGSAGGYLEALILNPSATYAYAVGAGGTKGAAAAGGATGGDGGSGVIIVEESY